MLHPVFSTHRRFAWSALLAAVVMALASTATAQSPPDSLDLVVQGPNAILVHFTACRISSADNCTDMTIYRNPPGFDTLLTGVQPADFSDISYLDTKLTPLTKYTYSVCTGYSANKDRSNCLEASATTMAVPPSGGSGGNTGSGSTTYTNNLPPPTHLQATAGGSSVLLSWINPPDVSAGIEVRRGITGATVPQPVTELPAGTTRWADTSPLTPHTPYDYWVCTGKPDASMDSCAPFPSVTLWGANPVLTAVRSSATTVNLSVAVDNLFTLIALKVTREGGDDPCRQGSRLGNGAQGCKTRTFGPGGVPQNAPTISTVYQISPGSSIGSNSTSPPWVIDIPDDTVTAGVEYYYTAIATWIGPLEQDSQTVTVSTTVPLTRYRGKSVIKSSVPSVHAGKLSTGSGSVNLQSAQARLNAHPNDAQALYAAGQAYCAHQQREACISTMYLGLLQSRKAGTTSLSNQITKSLQDQGVTVTENK
jgi:hypothetical protein